MHPLGLVLATRISPSASTRRDWPEDSNVTSTEIIDFEHSPAGFLRIEIILMLAFDPERFLHVIFSSCEYSKDVVNQAWRLHTHCMASGIFFRLSLRFASEDHSLPFLLTLVYGF